MLLLCWLNLLGIIVVVVSGGSCLILVADKIYLEIFFYLVKNYVWMEIVQTVTDVHSLYVWQMLKSKPTKLLSLAFTKQNNIPFTLQLFQNRNLMISYKQFIIVLKVKNQFSRHYK